MDDAPRTHYSPANEPGAPPVPAGPLGRAYCVFAHDAWRPERVRMRGLPGAAWRAARVLYLAGRRFLRDNCLSRASALTYITVLSLVPLLAFAFSMAKGFGLYHRLVEDALEPLLDRTFGPSGEAAQAQAAGGATAGAHEIRLAADKVLRFVEETDVSSLGTLGLLVLLWAVIKLLSTVEGSFNEIWGVKKPRSALRKLTDYLAMVVVTPIFLLTATGLTTAAENSGFVDFLRHELHLGVVIEVVLGLTPFLALWTGFTFLYLAMPNARTKLSSALIGALVGGTLWQIALLLHIKFQVGIARYNAIYSSFAAIPIFLIWVNTSWVTVLLGAEVCAAHQSEPDYLHLGESRSSDHKLRELLALRVFARITDAFLRGGEPWTAERLVDDLGVPLRPVEDVLYALAGRGLLAEVERQTARPSFLPARDPGSIAVKEVLDALKGAAGLASPPQARPFDEAIDRVLAGLDEEAAGSRWNRSMRALVETATASSGSSAAAPAARPRTTPSPR